MYKKITSVILAILLVIGVLPMNVLATNLWEGPAIQNAVLNGLIQGDQNGDLMQDNHLTRAQLAAILSRLTKTNMGSKTFLTDVNVTHWYFGNVENAIGLGLLKSFGSQFYPNENATIYDITTALTTLLQSHAYSKHAANFGLSDYVTRRDFAIIIDEAFPNQLNTPGTHNKIKDGNVIINEPSKLSNVTVNGNLIITSDVVLENVTVTGSITVHNGNLNLNKSTADMIILNTSSDLVIDKDSKVNTVKIIKELADIIIRGKVKTISVQAKNVKLDLNFATYTKLIQDSTNILTGYKKPVVEKETNDVEKSDLRKAIKYVERQNLKQANYTVESWANLETELNNANKVYNRRSSTQREVNRAEDNLYRAYDNLEIKSTPPVEPVVKFTVIFKNWNGEVISTQEVEKGENAVLPTSPTKEGYEFTGWDKSHENIQANTTIIAAFEIDEQEPVTIEKFTVIFEDWDETVLSTQQVEKGKDATVPTNPTRTGYTFTGWNKSHTNILANTTITATYTEDDVELTADELQFIQFQEDHSEVLNMTEENATLDYLVGYQELISALDGLSLVNQNRFADEYGHVEDMLDYVICDIWGRDVSLTNGEGNMRELLLQILPFTSTPGSDKFEDMDELQQTEISKLYVIMRDDLKIVDVIEYIYLIETATYEYMWILNMVNTGSTEEQQEALDALAGYFDMTLTEDEIQIILELMPDGGYESVSQIIVAYSNAELLVEGIEYLNTHETILTATEEDVYGDYQSYFWLIIDALGGLEALGSVPYEYINGDEIYSDLTNKQDEAYRGMLITFTDSEDVYEIADTLRMLEFEEYTEEQLTDLVEIFIAVRNDIVPFDYSNLDQVFETIGITEGIMWEVLDTANTSTTTEELADGFGQYMLATGMTFTETQLNNILTNELKGGYFSLTEVLEATN